MVVLFLVEWYNYSSISELNLFFNISHKGRKMSFMQRLHNLSRIDGPVEFFGGVLAGFSLLLKVPVWILRILFVIGMVNYTEAFVISYFILYMFMPEREMTNKQYRKEMMSKGNEPSETNKTVTAQEKNKEPEKEKEINFFR